MNSELIRVGGLKLFVADQGSGQPVLMLHGFPDSSYLWRNQIPKLVEAGFRVLSPDLRGFGKSDRPPDRSLYRMPHILGDLVGILDAKGVDRAHVVGHDWGAIVAWAFAGWHPERVAKLVSISVGHPRNFVRLSPAQILRSWYALIFGVPKLAEALFTAKDWALFRRVFGASPDFDHYLSDLSRPGALTAGLNWYRANGLRSFLRYPRVSVPTMGIWGAKDFALTEKQMTDSRRFVDGPWRYEKVEAGHWIPLRRPDLLNDLLLGFFSGSPD